METKQESAVEELIKEMQQLKDTKLYQGSFKAIDDCIHLAYAKLDTEKEQREKDLESGFHTGRLYQGREGDTTLEQLKSLTFKSE